MEFDIKRDFLDGILLQQPVKSRTNGAPKISANGSVHFLPSSPDGTMHTAVVSFLLQVEGQDQPFARGGWRFLFNTDKAFDSKTEQNHPFVRTLLVIGASKLMTLFNSLCMHANLPVIPLDPSQLAQAMTAQQATGNPAPPAPA